MVRIYNFRNMFILKLYTPFQLTYLLIFKMYHLQSPIEVVISGGCNPMCFKRFVFNISFMKHTTSVIPILLVIVTL